ncbi:acetate/propionate family kinase [Rhodoblastus sp. 17X3]|uniref:acetate/propionate family kinase n=1 Tax=Rhodoblastus sp. 17X3 TaxID=3047026 RepID=UPI0024B6676D|nr:acetate/propionate family kinase [Rhodoblastus sp. 17X3]MDI9847537.1 acetate/propionate family kinase [Rhodoblastus sp. 17X3]
MADCIAVINAGSSSIKFAIYEATPENALVFKGLFEGIGVDPHLKIVDAQGVALDDRKFPRDGFNHDAAMREIIAVSRDLLDGSEVVGFGHRVVHGGVHFDRPVIVTREILEELAQLCPLAPLHQPHNLAPIRTVFDVAPHKPQVACFDTAFHRSQPPLAQTFALPRRFTDDGVRRYGFHGISYEYLVSRFRELAPETAAGRVVFAHLGNGASLCAVKDGRSVASTMGFTAVDGLMMGTRCGALDPGVVLHLLQHYGMDARAIEEVIYKKSGLLGVSGISSDMRSLRASTAPEAREAISLFVYRIVRELGSLAAALGGLDALVFSGGIGEHDAATRAEVVEGSAWIGATLDPERNARGELRISRDGSRISVWAIPTDEERLIARQAKVLLS